MTWQELIDELQSQDPAALYEEATVMLSDGSRACVALAQDQDAARDSMILREVP